MVADVSYLENKKIKMSTREIIVRLIGGLGNQLFQIQYAIKLQEKVGGVILLDDSFLAASSKRHEKLAISDINNFYQIIRLGWIELNIKRVIEKIFYKLGLKVPKFLSPVFLFENSDIDLEEMEQVIIDGFWQDVTYLDERFIQFVRKFLVNNSSPANQQSNLVCVHIRRGDYLTNKHWGIRQQALVSLNYYYQAFAFFENEISTPFFEIYSDDELWAFETFGNKINARVVQSMQFSSLQLLSKMATYDNYVIANSSLSWWAAVLSKSAIKKVVIPSGWSIKKDSKKFQLPGWIVLHE
jgi:hypothetical protein